VQYSHRRIPGPHFTAPALRLFDKRPSSSSSSSSSSSLPTHQGFMLEKGKRKKREKKVTVSPPTTTTQSHPLPSHLPTKNVNYPFSFPSPFPSCHVSPPKYSPPPPPRYGMVTGSIGARLGWFLIILRHKSPPPLIQVPGGRNNR